MNPDRLLDAFSDLDEGYVRSSAALLGYEEEPVKHKKIKTLFRTLLIAAVIAALGIGTAWAADLFTMKIRTPEEDEELVVHQTYYDLARDENVTVESDLSHSPLVLQFTGEGDIHRIQFRPGWLPHQDIYSHESYHDEEEEDWFWYYTCFFDRSRGGAGVEYQIDCHYAWPGYTVYMDGLEAHVVKEEDWGDLHITEIEQLTYSKDPDGNPVTQRMLLLFDSSEGWFLSIGGRADFETLEHIAREMEVRTLDEIAEPSEGTNFYFLGVGVG